MNAVDCQGLGGSPALGAVNAGFTITHRVALPGGFGNATVEANRHLIPGDWVVETSGMDEWTPQHDVGLLTGCPPCSGFSLLNTSKKNNARGPDSNINDCMKALVQYAARCKGNDGRNGPEIVVFESVQGAFSKGRGLMQTLRGMLEAGTGEAYGLWHVLMSGASVGAPQYRHRYFFVASRIGFGIETPGLDRVATYRDAIGDLLGLSNTWEAQKIKHERTWWHALEGIRQQNAEVTGHVWATESPLVKRLISLAETAKWQPGEDIVQVIKRATVRPDNWDERTWDRLRDPENFIINGTTRVRWDRPGYVITGAGGTSFMHPDETRILSARECYRLMGFPDSWDLSWAKSPQQAYLVAGKQVPVQSTTWISQYAMRALKGQIPAWHGTEIGDQEYVLDITNDYRACYNPRTGEHGVDSRNAKLKQEMEARPA